MDSRTIFAFWHFESTQNKKEDTNSHQAVGRRKLKKAKRLLVILNSLSTNRNAVQTLLTWNVSATFNTKTIKFQTSKPLIMQENSGIVCFCLARWSLKATDNNTKWKQKIIRAKGCLKVNRAQKAYSKWFWRI